MAKIGKSNAYYKGFEEGKKRQIKDYVNFVQSYEGYWKNEYDKAIKEFLDDLKKEKTHQISKALFEKWEERSKEEEK